MQRADAGGKRARQHLPGQVRSGRPVDDEPIGGVAVVVNIRDGKRGRLRTKASEGEVGALGRQQVAQLLAEGVGREAPEKFGWNSQASEGSRCGERSAARRPSLTTVGGVDE